MICERNQIYSLKHFFKANNKLGSFNAELLLKKEEEGRKKCIFYNNNYYFVTKKKKNVTYEIDHVWINLNIILDTLNLLYFCNGHQ